MKTNVPETEIAPRLCQLRLPVGAERQSRMPAAHAPLPRLAQWSAGGLEVDVERGGVGHGVPRRGAVRRVGPSGRTSLGAAGRHRHCRASRAGFGRVKVAR